MNLADGGPHGRESLSLRIKLCYGSGDLVAGLAFNVLNFFYLYFLNTVVGMPAYLAGLVLLIGRAWDAVMDPVMGMIVDSTTSKQGKHRFWMLAAIGPFVIFFALLWLRFPGNQTVQFVAYSLLFVLFSTSFTMYNIPYGSMTADLTRDYHERTSLTGVRMVFSLFAMIIGAGATQLLAGIPCIGYPGMAGVYGVVMLGGGLTAVAEPATATRLLTNLKASTSGYGSRRSATGRSYSWSHRICCSPSPPPACPAFSFTL